MLFVTVGIAFAVFTLTAEWFESETTRIQKATTECIEISQHVFKYSVLEGKELKSLSDLKAKYVTDIDVRKDPWGNKYRYDPNCCRVISMGPDGKCDLTYQDFTVNQDNINSRSIIGLCLVSAQLYRNPEHAPPKYARDVLFFQFTKKVKVAMKRFNLNALSVPEKSGFLVPTTEVVKEKVADPACPKYAFRWSCNRDSDYCDGATLLRHCDAQGEEIQGPVDESYIDYLGNIPESEWVINKIPDEFNCIDGKPPENLNGRLFHTKDSMEICIVLPAGTSGSIIPGRHGGRASRVNLTGTKMNFPTTANPLFMEFDGVTPACRSRSTAIIDLRSGYRH